MIIMVVVAAIVSQGVEQYLAQSGSLLYYVLVVANDMLVLLRGPAEAF